MKKRREERKGGREKEKKREREMLNGEGVVESWLEKDGRN